MPGSLLSGLSVLLLKSLQAPLSPSAPFSFLLTPALSSIIDAKMSRPHTESVDLAFLEVWSPHIL